MSDSPINQVAIGSLFRLNGQPVFPALSPNDEFYHHSLPALDATGKPVIELGRAIESNKVLIDEPAVLVSKLNPRKPRVAVVVPKADERHCASTEFMCFVPRDRRDDLRYWAYYLGSTGFSVRLQRVAIGSTNSHTRASPSEVMRWVVPNPSHEEKRAIAGVLESLDTTIRQTEAIIAKLKQVKQGLLHDLLTRGIDANGELRPPQSEAPHLYKASPLGWIPVEWDTATLGRLSRDSTIGPFGSDLVASDYRASGVPVVFVRDVKADRFEWKSNVYVSTSKASALSAHEVRSGDVVATKMGLPPCVAAVYPESMPQGIITADIVRLRFDVNEVRPAWVSLSMNENSVIKQVEQITAGVTRAKVTLRDVRNIEIRFPPVNEQDRILDRMTSLDNRLAAESAVLEKLCRQKSGLMDDLLTGRVRVTPLLQGQAT